MAPPVLFLNLGNFGDVRHSKSIKEKPAYIQWINICDKTASDHWILIEICKTDAADLERLKTFK